MRFTSIFRVGFAVTALALAVSCNSNPASLPRAKAAPEVAAAVDSMLNAVEKFRKGNAHIDVHSVMLLKHGKVLFEDWYRGESADKPHVLFSVSKTFTSVAVGMTIADGKLALTDKLVDIFPEDLPDSISTNLAAVTVRDLLTMSCGQESEVTNKLKSMEEMMSLDWEKAFLAHDFPYEPGTHFCYNSIGTYMLSAIVQKVTGNTVLDLLDERLFKPLCIDRPVWDCSPKGVNCGGWGLYLKTEDMAKFGQLLLQNGKWHGKQIIPAEWIAEMSKAQVASAPAGLSVEAAAKQGYTKENSDWVQGYGYQCWRCRHNGYRADGKDGQYIIILPDLDAVIVLTSDANLYQQYIDQVWKYLLPVLQ